MPYLICDKCSGYYELQRGESPKDFDSKCECGGRLKYIQDLNNAGKFQKICSNCDSIIDENNKKCPVCGYKDEFNLGFIVFMAAFIVFIIDLVVGVLFVRLNRVFYTPFPKDFYSNFVLSSIVLVILVGVIIYIKRRIRDS